MQVTIPQITLVMACPVFFFFCFKLGQRTTKALSLSVEDGISLDHRVLRKWNPSFLLKKFFHTSSLLLCGRNFLSSNNPLFSSREINLIKTYADNISAIIFRKWRYLGTEAQMLHRIQRASLFLDISLHVISKH